MAICLGVFAMGKGMPGRSNRAIVPAKKAGEARAASATHLAAILGVVLVVATNRQA
jgi:hypothetical protein